MPPWPALRRQTDKLAGEDLERLVRPEKVPLGLDSRRGDKGVSRLKGSRRHEKSRGEKNPDASSARKKAMTDKSLQT